MDYSSFAEKCAEELKIVQDKFRDNYDINWYDNWFYDQTTGLLTFSTGDAQVNFRLINVGSFSETSRTWKWSWDNQSTLDSVKKEVKLVKEFGAKWGFSKLTNGYFESDEFEAWEFVAIAARLSNGIGVYRPVNDKGLQIFLVITEFVDTATAQKIKDRYIQCDAHQLGRIAFVCKHLNNNSRVGFEEAFETSEGMDLLEDHDFQAWCDECEVVRQKEGEWNDKSMNFAEIKLVCEKCYFEMKELNLGYR